MDRRVRGRPLLGSAPPRYAGPASLPGSTAPAPTGRMTCPQTPGSVPVRRQCVSGTGVVVRAQIPLAEDPEGRLEGWHRWLPGRGSRRSRSRTDLRRESGASRSCLAGDGSGHPRSTHDDEPGWRPWLVGYPGCVHHRSERSPRLPTQTAAPGPRAPSPIAGSSRFRATVQKLRLPVAHLLILLDRRTVRSVPYRSVGASH